jgi:hypothetical protein
VRKGEAETSVLFELVMHYYERSSLLVTSDQPFNTPAYVVDTEQPWMIENWSGIAIVVAMRCKAIGEGKRIFEILD